MAVKVSAITRIAEFTFLRIFIFLKIAAVLILQDTVNRMIYGINLGSLFRELPLAYEITAVIRVTIFTFLLSSVFSTIVAVTILRETMWRINHGVNFGSFFPTLISEALDVVIILSFFDYF